MRINLGKDLYLKGRIGWKGLSKDEYLDDGKYRIINGYSLKEGYIDWGITGYINKDRYEESPEIKLKVGDILITKDGTIGKVGIVRKLSKPSTVASGIFVLRNIIEEKLDTEYLFQYLNSRNFKNFIDRVKADGSTIKHLYQRDLVRLEIDIPKLSQQKKRAKILFDINKKIELNNKINTKLESMTKLIYDYWFVQFDFPDDNGKPYKSSGGKMIYNEELKREIPDNWKVSRLNTLIDYNSGYSFPSKSYSKSGQWKIITIKAVKENEFDTSKCDMINELPRNLDAECNLKIGDLLMSLTGNTGRLCFVSETNCLLNQRVAKIWSSKLSNYFIYLKFKRPESQKMIEQMSSGSSQANLSLLQLFKAKDIVPENSILKSFENKIEPIFQKILLNKKENKMLTELRDWLLPMLMNGQVTVK